MTEALAGAEHSTVHIGSIAVPGPDAKPIIDLDVVVPDQAGSVGRHRCARGRRMAARR